MSSTPKKPSSLHISINDAGGEALQAASEEDVSVELENIFSEKEILSYARYLFRTTDVSSRLLYIAELALSAPLPEGWKEHEDSEGFIFYYNEETDISTREHPLEEFFRKMHQVYQSTDSQATEAPKPLRSALHDRDSIGSPKSKVHTCDKDSTVVMPEQVMLNAAIERLKLDEGWDANLSPKGEDSTASRRYSRRGSVQKTPSRIARLSNVFAKSPKVTKSPSRKCGAAAAALLPKMSSRGLLSDCNVLYSDSCSAVYL
mmetsp:Transcript_23318/g.38377  ORF Transcript_23318/g.38377 Transcript_23318/m.38377 type:complete len:260 (-) Transcript_23318:296-1075(-)|eukprot:CAMPEP_0184649134 /NCGR_PEP_ID=MMETSP0308-20130426/6407_1 /TAXON_ID=38269 /ORGANISM="Gloeochaete witrockiana, Strain SAG 46.84" /LENGTH=259 /DNA_ID=CAMNT_0027081577 /DNA_START=133 /DNA_END=912 /DNA_ORIENTATION=-